MKKSEFNLIVDNLLSKLDGLIMDDYRDVSQVISEFKQIIRSYSEFLNQFVDEDLGRTQNYFKESRRYKRGSLKEQNWNMGVERLYSEIESMKSENTFPN